MMNKNLKCKMIGCLFALGAMYSYADSEKGAAYYMQSCLSVEVVKSLTGLSLIKSAHNTKPQVSCSYSNNEQLSKQSRVLYGRDPSYRKAFGESDIMQTVNGLGNFSEFDVDAGQLYVNLGDDGIVFEGRHGKTKLPLEKLKAIAEKVLQNP